MTYVYSERTFTFANKLMHYGKYYVRGARSRLSLRARRDHDPALCLSSSVRTVNEDNRWKFADSYDMLSVSYGTFRAWDFVTLTFDGCLGMTFTIDLGLRMA